MKYKVQMRNDKLGILDNDDYPIYVIDKKSLPAVLKVEGASCSECIIKLSSSPDVTLNLLYNIAFQIQRNFPSNGIDWFTTFYHIEKSDYLEMSYRIVSLLERGNEETSFSDKISHMKQFLEFEPVEDIDTKLLKIVMMNLISHKIINR